MEKIEIYIYSAIVIYFLIMAIGIFLYTHPPKENWGEYLTIKARCESLRLLPLPGLNTIYDFKCNGCGKLIIDHDFGYQGTTSTWDSMKVIYDLGTCKIPKGYIVKSYPNGFGSLSTNIIIPGPPDNFNELSVKERRDWLAKNVWT